MRLSRHMSAVEQSKANARQALLLAERARAQGEEDEARKYERTAQAAATQLVSSEQAVEDLKTLHDQALNAAQQARRAVENNKMLLEEKLAERAKLLSQLEQAKMQETVAASLESMSALAAPGNTPSLDEIRDKIESRYASAMGRAELASDSVEGRMLEVRKTTLEIAGSTRLDQIRHDMAAELEGTTERPAVAAGDGGEQGQDATVSRLDEIRASIAKESGKTEQKGEGAAAG
jgi:phage shock protein A